MEDTVLEKFSKDEVFKEFCENEFDAKSFATRIIKSHAVSQQLSTLATGIGLLDKELNQQVSDHYEDLMSQATGIEALESVLQVIQARSQSLLAAIEKIRAKVVEPYDKIVTRTLQLRRIQETCDMLRQVIREMFLSRKLRGQISAGSRDATKAAQSLNELDYLFKNGINLSGISVLEDERTFIKEARHEVELMADKMLKEAMSVQNQSQVATSLQIFFNLSLLSKTTDQFMVESIEGISNTIKYSLDVSGVSTNNDKRGGPGRVSGIGGNSALMRASLWSNLEKLTDEVYNAYSRVLLLQKVLARKRDPISHVLFIDHLKETKGDSYGNLVEEFWHGFTQALKQHIELFSEGSTLVKQAFESEYPKLLRLFLDLFSRIQSLQTPIQPALSFEPPEVLFSTTDANKKDLNDGSSTKDPLLQLLSSFQSFETAHLSRSLSRLFDPINLVFSSSSSFLLPTTSDLEAIIKTMSSELLVSSFDGRFNELISRNVSKTIIMLCTKYEQQVNNSEDAVRLNFENDKAVTVTEAQKKNIDIFNSLVHFHEAAQKAFKNLTGVPPSSIEHLTTSLYRVTALLQSVMEPLLCAMQNRIEELICNMNQEDFSMPMPSNGKPVASSSYMEVLQKFIKQASISYLDKIKAIYVIQPRLNKVARRSLELFVRHASLVYPLGEGGKLKLSADFSKIESAVKPLCDRLSDLGIPYRLVRAVRPVMFQPSEVIASSTTPHDVLPLSTTLHFLFSRGQPQLRPPYQTAGWSTSQYSKWMDEHTNEKDRLLFIKGSLESYEQSVRSRGGKQFVDVYPIMLDLLLKNI